MPLHPCKDDVVAPPPVPLCELTMYLLIVCMHRVSVQCSTRLVVVAVVDVFFALPRCCSLAHEMAQWVLRQVFVGKRPCPSAIADTLDTHTSFVVGFSLAFFLPRFSLLFSWCCCLCLSLLSSLCCSYLCCCPCAVCCLVLLSLCCLSLWSNVCCCCLCAVTVLLIIVLAPPAVASTVGAAVRGERRVATDIHKQRERLSTFPTGRLLLRGDHVVAGACFFNTNPCRSQG